MTLSLDPKQEVRVMIGASEADADLLYACRMFVPDPVLCIVQGATTYLFLSELEYDRGTRQARGCVVLPLGTFEQWWREQTGGARPSLATLAGSLMMDRGIGTVTVPSHMSIAAVRDLERCGLLVEVAQGPFWPERRIKGGGEVQAIQAALNIAQSAIAHAIEIVGAASIGNDGVLIWQGGILTSERLRGEANAHMVRLGGIPKHTITACGAQAADPHEVGSGPVRAGETLVLDFFPRDERSGYFGDITRTVVKGRANDEIKRRYELVRQGQQWMIDTLHAGVDGGRLHEQLMARFTQEGYPTAVWEGRRVGFFHGTGHGLGLEIHEAPRIGINSGILDDGVVVTVEPGLYDPRVGGIRLEDVVWIQKDGAVNLTTAPKVLEIE